MVLTVEISMYPFHENYKDLIKDFIGKLEGYRNAGLKIAPGPTSTRVVGEFSCVMEALGEMMQWSHDKHGRAVFVTKFIPGYEASTDRK